MDSVFAFSPACYLRRVSCLERCCVGQNNPPNMEEGTYGRESCRREAVGGKKVIKLVSSYPWILFVCG